MIRPWGPPHADRAVPAQVEAGRNQVPARSADGPTALPLGPRRGTGLALSGGGYRAALFHLGALRRLDELGILTRLRTVTGVSGGSLVAALLQDPRLGWSGDHVEGFERLVAEPLRALASTNVRTPAVLSRLAPSRWFVVDGAVRGLGDALARAVPWWSIPLRDVTPSGPAVVVVATEVGYGLDWHFRAAGPAAPHGLMGDYRLGYAPPPPQLRVADAVATSCALPPLFAPRALDGRALGLVGGTPGTESAPVRAAILRDIRLSDGAVYDNLGLEPLWKDHEAVLLSDGGPVFRPRTAWTPLGWVVEAVSLAADSSTSVRLRWLHAMMAARELGGATWTLDTGLDPAVAYPVEVRERIARVRTDLDAFTTGEQQVLERYGYLVADAMVQAHAPELVRTPTPARPPHRRMERAQEAFAALEGSDRRSLLGRR